MGYNNSNKSRGNFNGNRNGNGGNRGYYETAAPEVSDRDYEKNKRKDRWESKKRRKGHGGSDDYDPSDW
jgi:hypothetical protein